jgi:hypothetical protein
MSLCLSAAASDRGPELEVVNLEGLTAGYWHEGIWPTRFVAQATGQQLVTLATELGADQPEHWL